MQLLAYSVQLRDSRSLVSGQIFHALILTLRTISPLQDIYILIRKVKYVSLGLSDPIGFSKPKFASEDRLDYVLAKSYPSWGSLSLFCSAQGFPIPAFRYHFPFYIKLYESVWQLPTIRLLVGIR